MSVQNVSLCPSKTSPCVRSKRPSPCRGCFECTHGDVLDGHTGFFSVSHHTTPHTRHKTQDTTHKTTQQPQQPPQQHMVTDRQRETEKEDREREREDEIRKTRRKTREKKMKDKNRGAVLFIVLRRGINLTIPRLSCLN